MPRFFWLFVFIAVSGCASIPPKLDPALRPAESDFLRFSQESAVECVNPVVPKVKLGKSFKYACFCGADHPNIKRVEAETLENLIGRYYKIKPIDEIDAACRDHDVCWVINGDGYGKCNDELYDRLSYLGSQFDRAQVGFDTDNAMWRCQILAGDMASAFNTVFVESKYTSPGTNVGAQLARWVLLPFQAVIPVLRLPIWMDNPYPLVGERCNLPQKVFWNTGL